LRIKVMQALYAFFQSGHNDLARGEKEMFHAIGKIYDMYHFLLRLLVEIRVAALRAADEAKLKHRPTQNDLNPNPRFIDNRVLLLLEKNRQLGAYCEKHKISWTEEGELVRKILASIRNSPEYEKYLAAPSSFDNDKAFILTAYKNHIADYELLEHFFEEKSIFWVDDIGLVNACVLKTIEAINENDDGHMALLPLYKNEEEDTAFARELFHQTVLRNEENEKLIGNKTKNWEVERIAMMDVLLMKMGISELLHFHSIPVKVTLNEYIEISKMFSTPKSKIFINGILDKLVQDFRRDDRMRKTGRGLIE